MKSSELQTEMDEEYYPGPPDLSPVEMLEALYQMLGSMAEMASEPIKAAFVAIGKVFGTDKELERRKKILRDMGYRAHSRGTHDSGWSIDIIDYDEIKATKVPQPKFDFKPRPRNHGPERSRQGGSALNNLQERPPDLQVKRLYPRRYPQGR